MLSHARSCFEQSVTWQKVENLVVTRCYDKIYPNPKTHMHNIVGGLFRLTTRFCNLIDVRDLVKEVNYDHCNSIQKHYVIFRHL
jgi:hypothetical protein